MTYLIRALAFLSFLALLGGGCLADGKCFQHSDCGDGKLCQAGSCVAIECADDSRCDSGEFCKAGICATRECNVDGDCGADRYCYRYQCLSASGGGEDWALLDRNPLTATRGQEIGPQDYAGEVLLLYFAVTT